MGRSQERELPPALCHGTIGESREGAEENIPSVPTPAGALIGSSRMTRKCHIRFLGGLGVVRLPGHPPQSVEYAFLHGAHLLNQVYLFTPPDKKRDK